MIYSSKQNSSKRNNFIKNYESQNKITSINIKQIIKSLIKA